MKKEEYLKTVEKQIQFFFDRKDITKELDTHLLDSMEDLMEEGLTKEEAEKEAVKRMGDPIEVGKQLNKEHHPFWGYMLLATRIIMTCLLIYVILFTFVHVGNIRNTFMPALTENSVEEYAVQYEVKIPTYRIVFENICVDKSGQYTITYKAWRDYAYNRAGTQRLNIRVQNEEGYWEISEERDSMLFGYVGYIRFEYPEDGILSIRILGEDIELDLNLGEYIL